MRLQRIICIIRFRGKKDRRSERDLNSTWMILPKENENGRSRCLVFAETFVILEGSTGEIQRKEGGEGVVQVVASFLASITRPTFISNSSSQLLILPSTINDVLQFYQNIDNQKHTCLTK